MSFKFNFLIGQTPRLLNPLGTTNQLIGRWNVHRLFGILKTNQIGQLQLWRPTLIGCQSPKVVLLPSLADRQLTTRRFGLGYRCQS